MDSDAVPDDVRDVGMYTRTVPSGSLSERNVLRDTRLRTASFVIPSRSDASATVIRSSRPASRMRSSPTLRRVAY
jgi:hypothetical protein